MENSIMLMSSLVNKSHFLLLLLLLLLLCCSSQLIKYTRLCKLVHMYIYIVCYNFLDDGHVVYVNQTNIISLLLCSDRNVNDAYLGVYGQKQNHHNLISRDIYTCTIIFTR